MAVKRKAGALKAPKLSAVAKHRARQQRRGLRRIEVHVPVDDAGLVRAVAAALSDPTRADATRTLLSTRLFAFPEHDFKALLEAAPLEDCDIDRPLDYGRPVDL